MNIFYKGHLNDKAKNEGKNAYFEVSEFHDFNGCNYNADAYDIVDNPVFFWKVVT